MEFKSCIRDFKKTLIASFLLLIASVSIGIIVQFALFNHSPVVSDHVIYEESWYFYFKNNFISCLIISLGIFFFGIPSIGLILFNGFMLGNAIANSFTQEYGVINILLALVPHGIFEISAIILAGGIGLKGITIYQKGFTKTLGIRVLLLFSLISLFLLIASVIEANISKSVL